MNYKLHVKELESENERLKTRIDNIERDLADSVRSELDLHEIIKSLNEQVKKLRAELNKEIE